MSVSTALKQLNSWPCFGGLVKKFAHQSQATNCEMKFSLFLPPQAQQAPVPALYFLSGLTCTEDNFIQKSGACRAASLAGIALICPDTSPRGVKIEGDNDSWDLGVGAGFYVNATEPKWSKHYRMFDYVTKELPQLVKSNFPLNNKQAIFGHSMGGHGALISYLKNPNFYSSVSAFSPICHPSVCPWGVKAFTAYMGQDQKQWKEYDATELIRSYQGPKANILIDQGSADEFLEKKQLLPDDFREACAAASHPLTYREQKGYDHSYWFIQTFIDDHIQHHAKALFS